MPQKSRLSNAVSTGNSELLWVGPLAEKLNARRAVHTITQHKNSIEMMRLCEMSHDELIQAKIHARRIAQSIRRDIDTAELCPSRLQRMIVLFNRAERRLFRIYDEFERRARRDVREKEVTN